MKLTIRSLAEQINEAAPDYEVGGLQQFRAKLHRCRARTQKIFSKATIFDPYAFHDGGRPELQYNIAVGNDGWCRHGVAFSIERSRSLPDPLLVLEPKAKRFNSWLRANPQVLKGFTMSIVDPNGEWSGEKPLAEIPADWMKDGAFIFLGKYWPKPKLNIRTILQDFDRVYPAYKFVESGSKTSSSSPTNKKMHGSGRRRRS